MDAMTGIILTEDKETQLGTLTEKRAISAMPMAGRYRLIDFILSSMVNSGIRNVGVATQFNYSSLMDHLGSGKDWDLSRKIAGFIFFRPTLGGKTPARRTAISTYSTASEALSAVRSRTISCCRRATQCITQRLTMRWRSINKIMRYYRFI